jgi:lipopolysaccharide biosynthesis protein
VTLNTIAFYLPQFHAVPENDEFWGTGFTDWVNVRQARPWFAGHYQPHVPGAMGYYDLAASDVLPRQAALARDGGVTAFCFYHYWFHGQRVLEGPVERMLRAEEPDMPFCLCWANESWTRRWDGRESDVLIEQRYSADDDRAHAHALLPALGDSRYLRFSGRPLLLVYRASRIPDPRRTTETWRQVISDAGLGDPLLARVESFGSELGDPRPLGFDIAVEFRPGDFSRIRPHSPALRLATGARRAVRGAAYRLPVASRRPWRMPYDEMVRIAEAQPEPGYPRWPCVFPSWDNTPRRGRDGLVFTESTPEAFERWCASVLAAGLHANELGEALFVNAWNEWAEGAHLEPDERWGDAYLRALARATAGIRASPCAGTSSPSGGRPGAQESGHLGAAG